MSRTKRPRRPHRPRLTRRPVLEAMRRDLVLPGYLAIDVLRTSGDDGALESARHSLAALLDYMGLALQLATRPIEACAAVEAGKLVLADVIRRQEATGTLRCTGLELQALRAAVTACDEQLPSLGTDHIQRAVLAVNEALFGQRMPHHLRPPAGLQIEVAR